MKHGIAKYDSVIPVSRHISSLKRLVRLFMHTTCNNDLPVVISLIQEAETRFGTFHDVSERILKAAEAGTIPISEKHSESQRKVASALMHEIVATPALEGVIQFVSIEAIV